MNAEEKAIELVKKIESICKDKEKAICIALLLVNEIQDNTDVDWEKVSEKLLVM